jgi:hypothetical protein
MITIKVADYRIEIAKEWVLLIIFTVIKLLIHFLTNTNYELHRDAFLYLALGDHPDFGYMSVPPSIAVFANITRFLFGDSVFSIRLFPALIGAASIVIIGLIVKELGGKTWAVLIAASAFIVSPSFLRSNTLFQPVSFNQFYWLLTGYFIVKLVQTKNPKFWIHLAITWGLAFLNKYSIAFLIIGFIFALSLTSDRRLYKSKHFFLAILIGFIIVLPNLLWQHIHNWPVITHMLQLQRTQLVNVDIAGFIVAQFLMNLPGVFIWMLGLIYLLLHRDGRDYRVLAYTFLAVLLILLVLRGKAYYTLGMYSILFAAGGVAIESYFKERLFIIKYVLLLSMIIISLPVVPYSLPLLPFDKMAKYAQASKDFGLSGALRWEDGRIHSLPQDYADMIGWRELSDIVISAYQGLNPIEKAQCAIYAENYGEAGAILYHGKKSGIPECISLSDNFLFWAPDSVNQEILIYVNDDTRDISYYFENIELLGRLTNKYARESGVPVYLCKIPRNNFEKFYSEKIEQLKSQFRR